MAAAPVALPDTLPFVRQTVRELLLRSPAYHDLPAPKRTALANSMVRVCGAAADLIREEVENDAVISTRRPRLVRAQNAGDQFSGVSAQRVAGTTQAILNAVSFPRFVTELINGVFKAMVDSSTQQMQAFVELLNNVSASLDGFADSNIGEDRARLWLAEKYPQAMEASVDQDDPEEGVRVRLREGASMPTEEQLRTDLGLGPDETVQRGDPESMLPFVRRRLAQQRQGMLSTMVMLGLQRIVVESGSIRASMRFHIDTRSAAQSDEGSTFNFQNQINASGSFGVGAWGASASMSNTIGYVSTQRNQTTEEMNTDLELTSAVEINFKSDYLPLNRVAAPGQADRIRANSLNPAEEARTAEAARRTAAVTADQTRSNNLNEALRPQTPNSTAAPPLPTPKNAPATPAAPATKTGTAGGTGSTTTPGGGTTPTPGSTTTTPGSIASTPATTTPAPAAPGASPPTPSPATSTPAPATGSKGGGAHH